MEPNQRVDELRNLIHEGIGLALKMDDHCKSYEGELSVSVVYPNYFEYQRGNGTPIYVIKLLCYVLGPSRHYEWSGATLDLALDEAFAHVTEWVDDVRLEEAG